MDPVVVRDPADRGVLANARMPTADIFVTGDADLMAVAATSYPVGVIHAGLGDTDQAFAWFERAFTDRSGQMVFYLATDNRMDPLRSDPRFVSLQKRIGLPTVPVR